MGGTWYRNKHGRQYYRRERDKEYQKNKTDYVKANDKLKMLGILFTAAYRAVENKGVLSKYIRIFLYEEPEEHDWNDEKRYDRIYYSIVIDRQYFRERGLIRTAKIRKRGKRKSQMVKV